MGSLSKNKERHNLRSGAPPCFLLSHTHGFFFFFWSKKVASEECVPGLGKSESQQIWPGAAERRGKAIQTLPHAHTSPAASKEQSASTLNGSLSLQMERGSHDTKERSGVW